MNDSKIMRKSSSRREAIDALMAISDITKRIATRLIIEDLIEKTMEGENCCDRCKQSYERTGECKRRHS